MFSCCTAQEKEKEIEVKNIYTQRMPKSIPRLLPRLPATCDAATMTDAPEPTAHRGHAPKGKPLPLSPAVPKQRASKTSPLQAGPLDSDLQQEEATPSHTSPTPNIKPEEPRPLAANGAKEMPQSSTPHPASDLKLAQPPEVAKPSSNPLNIASSSLAGTPATTSVSSTKESIAEDESARRGELDLSSIHQTPTAATPPAGDTTVTAGSQTSTQQPQLAHDGPKLPQSLVPADGGMTKEDEERKNEQERKKALLLARLQAIDEGGTVEPLQSGLPPANKQGGDEARGGTERRASPLQALQSQTPDFGRTSVLQQRLNEWPQGTSGDVISTSTAVQMEDARVPKGGRRDTVTDLSATDGTAKSSKGPPPFQPQRPFPTQTIAQPTFDDSVATKTQLAGVASGNSLDKHPMMSSSGSLPQWPNTVHNMYLGKPALATAEDPFGTRLSGRSNRSNPRLKEKGTPLHGTDSADALSQYKPKFSRRAQQNATTKRVDKGIGLSEDSQTQLITTMASPRRAKQTKDSGSGLGSTSLSDMHQPPRPGVASKPLGATSHNGHNGYPWEMEVNLSSVAPGQATQSKTTNGLRLGQVDSAKKTHSGSSPLLPHRKTKPLQPAIGMSSMPGAIFDDDIEELSLT